jgi:1-acyl-sn-glycerol-3-phosphate acyltransferase
MSLPLNKWLSAAVRSYLALVLFVLRAAFGLRWEIRGDVAAARGPVLIAAKHQSALETIILQHALSDPAIILKRELLAIPILGIILRRLGHIGVDRSGDLDEARRVLVEARRAHEGGRPVVIFPEGTRREVGAPADYKAGVELLYGVLKAPCVPVAVNSGRVWPGRFLLPRPGRVVIEFLPAIEAGLPRAVFGARLKRELEEATARLLREPM